MASGPEFDESVDWTSAVPRNQNGQVERRLANLERKWAAHLFLDAWQSNQEFPHPNQSVNVLNFFEGNGRLDNAGIQLVTDNSLSNYGIFWLGQFTDSPNTASQQSKITGWASAPGTLPTSTGVRLWSIDQLAQALISNNASDGTDALVNLTATSPIGSALLEVSSVPAASTPLAVKITNAPFGLATVTSDFAAIDGMLWYRSDTDVFRARVNGVTVDLLHSGSVIPVVLTNLKVPWRTTSISAGISATTDTAISVNASGAARTETLPAAATAGAGTTYMLTKSDATNNTVTIATTGGELIDGVATYVLNKQYEAVILISTGSAWQVMASFFDNVYSGTTATSVTVGQRETFVGVSTALGNTTVNLPTAVGIAGREITIKKTTSDTNTCTVDPNSTQTIDGVTTYVLTSPGEITICSDGANWLIKNTSFDGFRATTTTATTTAADRTVSCNASGGAYSVTLVTAVGNAGLTQVFKKIGTDTNIVTIDGNASETIDGVLTIGLSNPNQFYALTSDGTNWLITGAGM